MLKSLRIIAIGSVALASAWAQSASVAGLVVDPSGRPIPGAELILVSPATGWKLTTRTDPAGGYRFAGLLPGTYELTASAEKLRAGGTPHHAGRGRSAGGRS